MRLTIHCSVLLIAGLVIGCSASDSGTDDSGTNEPGTVVPPPSATAGWIERAKLEAAEGNDFDSVFLSGDRALIGGAGIIDDFTGAVAVYERDADGTWASVEALVPLDVVSGDLFSSSMALFGDTALIVSQGDDDVGMLDGSAYFFERRGAAGWVEVGKVLPDAGTGVSAVSIDGERALLGGSDFASPVSGVAQILERDADGVWQRVATLAPGDAPGFDLLGLIADGVSLSGNRAMVSAPRDSDNGRYSGAVYLYERDGDGEWREQAKLIASDASADDYFGASVSLFGDIAVIGQFNAFRPLLPSAAYVFERNADGVWLEMAKLTASDTVSGDHFGRSVSLFAERVLVSAPNDGFERAGAVYVFDRDESGEWLEVDRISAGEPSDSFGWSISLSGDRALIAAPGAVNASSGDGVAYVYEKRP